MIDPSAIDDSVVDENEATTFGRLSRYVSAKLHRRLFLWFGLTIVLTASTTFLVRSIFPGARDFHETITRVHTFIVNHYVDVYDDAAKRSAFTTEISAMLDLPIEVRDVDDRVVSVAGGECARTVQELSIVSKNGQQANVRICRPSHRRHLHFFAALAAAIAVLWLMAGVFARTIARPISTVVDVAQRFGRGEYQSRVGTVSAGYGEVSRLAVVFDGMAAKIERQLSDHKELLAAVSHELRTPLGHVRLLLELVAEAANDDERSERLQKAEREITYIDRLISEILAHARLDFTNLEVSKFEIRDLLTDVMQRLDCHTEIHVEGAPRAVTGDATLLAMALRNLLENASAHGGGAAGVYVRFHEHQIEIEVKNRAIAASTPTAIGRELGIAEAFAPFANRGRFPASRSTERGEEIGALGLGLYLVKKIADAHGGEAYTHTHTGGAVFGLRLPT